MSWKQEQIVGRSVHKVDAMDKAAGSARYTSDMVLPNMLEAKLVTCPHARARILSINKAEALKVPGVQAILTWEDVTPVRFSTAGYPKETIPGMVPVPLEYLEDKILMDREINYRGEPAAIIVAKDRETAQAAEKLLKIEYEVLRPVVTIDDALAPDAPEVHKGTSKNVIATSIGKGDTEEGFKLADKIYENTYYAQAQQHCCMETTISIADVSAAGKVTLWSTTQVPFHIRRGIAEVFGLPMSKIRVVKPTLGGGFGERQMVQNEFLCVFAALKTRRPVRMATTREENIHYGCHRHESKMRIKTGVTKDGKITAMETWVQVNAGAYTGHSPYVAKAMGTKYPYNIEHIKHNVELVYTNTSEAGAYRGYGNPQISFARECLYTHIARDLGMDIIDFKLKNLVIVGEANPIALKSDWILESCGLDQCLIQGREAIGWDTPKKPNTATKCYGRGVAASTHVTGISAEPDFSSANVKIAEDGSVFLLIGSPDLGQGSDTTHAQIAAETIGVSMDKVFVYSADTENTALDYGSYASRQTYVAGNAIKAAAEKCKQHLLRYASEMTGQVVGNLDTADDWVVRRENGRKVAPIDEVAYFAVYKSKSPMAINETASYSSLNCPPSYAAHFAEVEVDKETGAVRILKYVAAHDAGHPIHPRNIEGQIEGCLMQGIGYTLSERMIYDDQGVMLNASFTDYKVPHVHDMPDEVIPIIVDTPDPTGPFGAKGVGEMAIAPVPGAIVNAINDALGIELRSLPLTKEVILKAIKEAGLNG